MRRLATKTFLLSVLITTLLTVPVSAFTVTGKVENGSGFKVLIFKKNGTSAVDHLDSKGLFKVQVKQSLAATANVHFVDRKGHYFGPLVLKRQGKTGWLSLSGGSVNLGRIAKHSHFLTLRSPIAKGHYRQNYKVTLTNAGKPLLASVLGFNRKHLKGAHVAAVKSDTPSEPPLSYESQDPDKDGAPNAIDVDNDNNGVLDVVEPTVSARTDVVLASILPTPIDYTVNASVGDLDDAILDATNKRFRRLSFGVRDNAIPGQKIKSVDVDCLGKLYCSNAYFITPPSGLSRDAHWPDYDPNNNGLPNLEADDLFGGFATVLFPAVGMSDLKPDDTFAYLAQTDSETKTLSTVLGAYLLTTPAMTSLNDGVTNRTFSYPINHSAPGGTSEIPIDLATETLSVRFKRPQRRGIVGADSSSFVNMGQLRYGLGFAVNAFPEGKREALECVQSTYSNLSPTLSPRTDLLKDYYEVEQLQDSAPDGQDDELGFTVDLGACIRQHNINPSGLELKLEIASGDRQSAHSDQLFQVTLPKTTAPCPGCWEPGSPLNLVK